MPRFTIGMPTYNRAHLLPEALESALNQTYPDVEIIVCDDASEDHTTEVVRRYGDRVRYHRNPTNIGMYPNFAKAIELAGGEYFSLLQDDDLIHKDFVRRALNAFERDNDIVLYSGFALWSPSPTTVWIEKMLGPPFPVDWMGEKLRIIDGIGAIPFLQFVNISTYPLIAFRTDVVRRAASRLLPNCEFFNENILMACTLTEGKMAIDPWICAFHREHPQQVSLLIAKERGKQQQQWRMLAGFFEQLLPTLPGQWRDSFREALEEIAAHTRAHILMWATQCAGNWHAAPSTARELKDLFVESIPKEKRDEIPKWITTSLPMTWTRRVKQAVRQTMPPKMVRIINAIRS